MIRSRLFASIAAGIAAQKVSPDRIAARAALAAAIGLWMATAGAAFGCDYNTQCPPPQFCLAGGSCSDFECSTDRDCPYGQFCNSASHLEPGTTEYPPPNFSPTHRRCLPRGVDMSVGLHNGVWTIVVEDFDAYQARIRPIQIQPGYAQPNTGANLGSSQLGSAQPVSAPPMVGGVVGIAQPRAVSGKGEGSSYFRGADNTLWVRSTKGQEQPTNAGALSTTDLVWVTRFSGEDVVIHRDYYNKIWMIACRASQCGPWIDLRGQLQAAPTVSLGADGGIVVRGTGMDGATWQTVLYEDAPGNWAPVDN